MAITREKYQMAFGKRFEYVMRNSGMKYEAVADRADLSINVLHRLTHGSAIPSVYTFAKLCYSYATEAEAIEAWNTRAERTCRITEYDEAPFPVCSECGAVQPDDYAVYYCWSCGAKVVGE